MKLTPLLITAMVCLTVVFVSVTQVPAQDNGSNSTAFFERRFQVETVESATGGAGYVVLVDGDTGRVWTRNVASSNRDWVYMGEPRN